MSKHSEMLRNQLLSCVVLIPNLFSFIFVQLFELNVKALTTNVCCKLASARCSVYTTFVALLLSVEQRLCVWSLLN